MNTKLLGAGAVLWTGACASPPREPAQLPPVVVSASATSAPTVAPEALPTTYAEIDKLLVRARAESESERKKTYALARQALVALTHESGRPAILTSVRTANGREETRLVPQNRRLQTERWGSLAVAGAQVVKVGDRVVSLDSGRITIWDREPVRIDSEGTTSLSVPPGETRFFLATSKKSAVVIDSKTGKAVVEALADGAVLLRSAAGKTRFAHQPSAKANTYLLSEIEVDASGAAVPKTVVEWRSNVAADASRGLVVVVRSLPDPVSSDAELCAIRLLDDVVIGKQRVSFEKSAGPFLNARISPDGKSFAFTTLSEARRFHLDTGRDELVKRLGTSAMPIRSVAFSADGAHVCADAPGDPFPRAKGVPGTSQRCYVAGDIAYIANLAAPPVGFRRASPEAFARAGFGVDRSYEAVSPGGALVAAILHDGKPAPLAPQRFTVAVYDARTGKQLWNQFLDSMRSLDNPADLGFSDDGAELLVDGVRLDARTGAALDDKPVDSASLTPLMKRFGMNVDGKTLSLRRLGYDVPFFQTGQLVWTVDLAPRPLSIILDPVTLTLALRGNGSKQSIVLASGPTSALAFLPDGSFAKSGEGSDLVCELGSVLAPIEVCQTKQEIPALRVPAALGDLSK